MNISSIRTLAACALFTVAAATSHAQTTYTYTGQNLQALNGSTGYTNVTASVTFKPGAVLNGFATDQSQIDHWSISDGVHTFTSTDTPLGYFALTKDSNGIVSWAFLAYHVSTPQSATDPWVTIIMSRNNICTTPSDSCSIFNYFPSGDDNVAVVTFSNLASCQTELTTDFTACLTGTSAVPGSWSGGGVSVPEVLLQMAQYVQGLTTTQKQSLISQITTVLNNLGYPGTACSVLQALKNHVSAQRGKQLTLNAADYLLGQVTLIADAIPCQLN